MGWGGRYKTVVLIVGLAGLLGCQTQPEGTVVATVGKRRLMLQEVESRIPVQLAGKVGVQGKRRLVEGWVEEELFYQEALQRKLDKDPAVAARISDAVRDMLVAEFLEQEFKRDSDVLEGEILDYYEAHRDDFVRELPEIRARHILVSNRDALNRVWQRLQDGEPFERMARAESIDSSAEDGGRLGYFTEDQADPSFWEACQKARVGRRVRESTRRGYHIIEVLDRREAGSLRDLLEVRGEIRQRVQAKRRQAKRQKLLEELRNRIPWSVAVEVLGGEGENEGAQESGEGGGKR